MKATELRIGNYVWENYSGEMIIRSIIYNSPVTTHPKDNGSHTIHLSKTLKLPICGYDISAIKPIPITEEWLIKLGFEFKYNPTPSELILHYWIIKLDSNLYLKIFKDNSFKLCDYNSTTNDSIRLQNADSIDLRDDGNDKIKHIHQLQNLYFALTNKELLCNG